MFSVNSEGNGEEELISYQGWNLISEVNPCSQPAAFL